MVSVSCFGVKVSVMFHLMFVHYTLSSVHYVCLFVIFISHFGFESGICLLIAPVPVHCFFITSGCYLNTVVMCHRLRN